MVTLFCKRGSSGPRACCGVWAFAGGSGTGRLKRVTLATQIALAIFCFALPSGAGAESNPMYPVGEIRPLQRDSGVRKNEQDVPVVVYSDVVCVPNAKWMRLYFGNVALDRGGSVRITSTLDGETQELDAEALAMWSNSTAYFNGDEVTVELIAGARSDRTRLEITKLALDMGNEPTAGCGYPCGICGADDRVASSETWSARLFPSGCTASVWNTDSCMVSAGHCIGGSMVVQFNVPASTGGGGCSTVNPPIADQFPVLLTDSNNGGVGADWAAMTTGTNFLGERPFDRYGQLRPIASSAPSTGQGLNIWGFGIDPDCGESQTQQTSGGAVTSVSSLFFNHSVDATCGNSGSSVIRAGEILGIATHCPCNNVATRIDHPSFVAARDALCGVPCSPSDCADGNPCTTETCINEVCENVPNTFSCNDGNPCTIGDVCQSGNCAGGSPPDCSAAGDECNDASCNTGGATGNCDTLTPANEGAPCGGAFSVCQNGECVVDPGATRVFMKRSGAPESPSISALPGEIITLEVFVEETDPQRLGSYQIGLPGSASPNGAAGAVTYFDTDPGPGGSVRVDATRTDWVFFAEQPSPFLSETGLPSGFAFVANLPLGTGSVVTGAVYLGEFELEVSADACGSFTIDFLPNGAPPNGGSLLSDETGLAEVAATYVPLEILVGAGNDSCTGAVPLLGNDVSIPFNTNCAQQDGVLHACGAIDGDIWYAYTATCAGQLTVSTESGCSMDTAIAVYNPGAACIPSDADLLACANTPGACESIVTTVGFGDSLLIRIGSILGQRGVGTLTLTCAPDAEVTRIFMVRAGEEQTAPADAPTVLSMLPNETVPIEVWIEDTDGRQLGSYQIALPGVAFPSGGLGSVTYVDTPLGPGAGGSVVVDTARPDWVFTAEQPSPFYGETGLPDGFAFVANLSLGQGPVVPWLGYLGEFEFAASADTCGPFRLNFLPTGAPPDGGSFLADQTGNSGIPASYQPLDISVGPLNDACADAATVSGNLFIADFNTTCADADGVAHACGAIDSDIWYTYTAGCTGTLNVDTLTNCAIDTAIAVYNAGATCTPADAQLAACADTIGSCESLSVPVTLGDTVLVRVGSVTGDQGPGTLSLRCGGPCVTAEDCGDVDENGIVDDPCMFYACESNICNIQPRIHADMGSPNGECPLDGFANLADALHALTCFANTNTCDAINHDVGGPLGDCVPDGFCNLADALHALTAFAGTNTCVCPLDGAGVAPVSDRWTHSVEVVGDASLTVSPERRTARPGDDVLVRVFIDNPLPDLRAYQLDIEAGGGRRGRLDLVDISIEQRQDHVFEGDGFNAVNIDNGQMLNGLESEGRETPARGYLATYRYHASADAAGTFVIDVRRQGQTFLVATVDGKIELTATAPAVIVIASDVATGVR